MRFVSCLPVSQVNNAEEEVDEVILCEAQFLSDTFPSSADGLEQFTIKRIVVSEGTEIHQRQCCSLSDLHVFTELDKTRYVWYEFLRHLTCHKIYYNDMGGRIQYTRWTCIAPEGGRWSLCMELKSEGIIRRIAQLDLCPVTEFEVNLFQMANILYQDCCAGNDAIMDLKSETYKMKHHMDELQEERRLLDELIEKRDASTRSIVVGLLNEKKKKIVELQQRLCDEGPQDSEVINRNVKHGITEPISRGRKKRRANRSGPLVSQKEVKIKEEVKNEHVGSSNNDGREFNFLGIGKKEYPIKKEQEDDQDLLVSSTAESPEDAETSTEDEKESADIAPGVENRNDDISNHEDEDDEETDVE